MDRAAILNSYLFEIFKNHKLTKIFQKESYEKSKTNQFINDLKENQKKSLKFLLEHHQSWNF